MIMSATVCCRCQSDPQTVKGIQKMSKKIGIALLSLTILAVFAVAPASAASDAFATNITAGDPVYLGESGLDISNILKLGNKTLAWYSAGSSPATDTPAKTITLTDTELRNFYVDQARFGEHTGPWYAYNSDGGVIKPELAFFVNDLSLGVNLYNPEPIFLLDGKKITEKSYMAMRIDSSYAPLFQRAYTYANLIDAREAFDFCAFNRTGVANFTAYGINGYANYNDAYAAALVAADGAGNEANITVLLNRTLVPGINAYALTPENAKLTSLIIPEYDEEYEEEYLYYTPLTALHPSVPDYYVSPYINGIDVESFKKMAYTIISSILGMDTSGELPVWKAGYIIDEKEVLGYKILTGEYQFYAEININGMKDNLGEIEGKTVSKTAAITVEKESIVITADKETVIRNNGFSVKIEGNPKTEYIVWFTGVSGYDYKEVPAFIKDQDDVTAMTYMLAENTEYKSSGMKIAEDLPKNVYNFETEQDYTGNYAVVAKTDTGGVIDIGLMTNENTKDTTYKIRAQKIIDYANSDHTGYLLNMQLYDTVKVKVEKGTITISASGDGSYYLGEEVTLSGTNTDSDEVFLFITGPNLPVAGGKIDDPKSSPKTKAESTMINVKTDDTWEYKWDTSGCVLDAGTYTIYATSDFALKSGTNKTLSDVEYDTVSIVIKKPFVTATTSASTVAKGDKLYIRGTAEGNPTQGVGVWILGKNYWNGEKTDLMESTMVTETVSDDGSFEHELGSGDTRNLASGQYFVVVQHPMYNGVFDVKTQKNEDAKTIQVITNPKGTQTMAVNGVAFIIAGNGKLQGSDAAEALIQAINSANVDDTYTKLTFLVEEPWIRVNTVGDHYVGDQFKITGTTNLAVDDTLIVEVTSSSFQPTQKTQSGEFSGLSSTVKVTEGSTYNEWALDVDASTFKADEYIVNVEAIEADVTTTTTFNILSGTAASTPATTDAPATAATAAPTTAPTASSTPAATTAPGFGAVLTLIGLGAVGALTVRRD